MLHRRLRPRRAHAAGRAAADLPPSADGVLAVPPALLAGFGDHTSTPCWRSCAGSASPRSVSVHPLRGRAAPSRRSPAAASDGTERPVISPVCPAVVSLIELEIPFARRPPGAAGVALGGAAARPWRARRHLRGVVPEPAHRAARAAAHGAAAHGHAAPRARSRAAAARARADARAHAVRHGAAAAGGTAPPTCSRSPASRTCWPCSSRSRTAGSADVAAVEPFICDDGCFGSPLLGEDV